MTITTPILEGLTYESITAITSKPIIVIALVLFCVIIPLFISLIWACLWKGRSSSGQKLSSHVITNLNFWIAWFIYLLFSVLGILLIIYPVWILII